jgi:hypothetical protein
MRAELSVLYDSRHKTSGVTCDKKVTGVEFQLFLLLTDPSQFMSAKSNLSVANAHKTNLLKKKLHSLLIMNSMTLAWSQCHQLL